MLETYRHVTQTDRSDWPAVSVVKVSHTITCHINLRQNLIQEFPVQVSWLCVISIRRRTKVDRCPVNRYKTYYSLYAGANTGAPLYPPPWYPSPIAPLPNIALWLSGTYTGFCFLAVCVSIRGLLPFPSIPPPFPFPPYIFLRYRYLPWRSPLKYRRVLGAPSGSGSELGTELSHIRKDAQIRDIL